MAILGDVFAANAPQLASQVVTGLFNAHEAKKNREWNSAEAQKDRDFQSDMWQKTNDYNSPKSQMQRLKDAGLNPNMFYGDSAQMATAEMASGSAATGGAQGSMPMAQLMGLAQIEAIKASAHKDEADAERTEVDTNRETSDYGVQAWESEARSRMVKADLSNIRDSADNFYQMLRHSAYLNNYGLVYDEVTGNWVEGANRPQTDEEKKALSDAIEEVMHRVFPENLSYDEKQENINVLKTRIDEMLQSIEASKQEHSIYDAVEEIVGSVGDVDFGLFTLPSAVVRCIMYAILI